MSGNRVFMRLVGYSLRFPGRLVLIALGLAGLGGGQLYLTWIGKLWAEGPLITGDQKAMMSLMIQAVLTTIVMMSGLFSSKYLLNSVNQRMVEELRGETQRRLLAVELGVIRRYQSGELMSRIFNDAGALSGFVREIVRRLIGESFVIAGAVFMMCRLNWRLAILTGITVPIVALFLAWAGDLIRRISAQAQKDVGILSGILNEQLLGMTTIRSFQTETVEERRFLRQDANYRRQVLRGEWWSAMLTTIVWLITALGLVGVVWYGSNLVSHKQATAGGLLAFCLYAVQTAEPLRRLSEVQSLLQRAIAAAARVFEIIDLPDVEQGGELALPRPVLGEITFEHVHFRHRPEKPVLEDLDVRIRARETVAIVSTSGGGKSTLAGLMVRFYDPATGSIRLDGINIRELSLAELRGAVCVTEQEPFLFSGPLIDNIRYGSPEATETQVQAAAAQAGLEPLVRSLPNGIRSILLEGGRNLSGGQKQRIALARVIVRNPPVLVLDEATSALDSDTERQIFERIENWLSKRTVIVMAHRLATISRFPRIIVIDQGKIAGDGAIGDLMATCPSFKQLFADQLIPLGTVEKERALAS